MATRNDYLPRLEADEDAMDVHGDALTNPVSTRRQLLTRLFALPAVAATPAALALGRAYVARDVARDQRLDAVMRRHQARAHTRT